MAPPKRGLKLGSRTRKYQQHKRGCLRKKSSSFALKGDSMSKKKKPRTLRQSPALKNNLELRRIVPLTNTQTETFESYADGMNLMLHGFAGTGKSFISCYLAQEEMEANTRYDKFVIIRSVVPSRDIGFLPGTIKEKSMIYEKPYVKIFADLYGRGDAWQVLKDKQKVEFETTSFLRGCTIDNAIILVDEMQNMAFQELDTVMTRVGDNSRILFCGDYTQSDFVMDREKQGILKFINIIKKMRKFDFIEFTQDDIVRGGLVKDYIITRTEMEYQ
jgi:phosphate starvation-inducible protein PhoH